MTKTLILDVFCGLCNQFYDIQCGINFSLQRGYKFTFRYCSFRNPNLVSWTNMPFDELFEKDWIRALENYVDVDFSTLNEENTFNLRGAHCNELFPNNNEASLFAAIEEINKPYILLRQIWPVHGCQNLRENLYSKIVPNKKILALYEHIANKINLKPNEYNFLHYRYEKDFADYFKFQNESLESVLWETIPKFKNPNLPIYVATTNISNLISCNSPLYHKILTKDDSELFNYNFEELAFVDYIIGLNSAEVFGVSLSAFSHMLNDLKGTNNYYK
jgi:hypothetical protein